jgi:hypothetical protein
MNPMHVTIAVVLAVATGACVVVELGSCIQLLRHKNAPQARPLLVGLAAAIGAHLSVYGLTGHAWAAAFSVVPFAVVAVMCTPRTWQPPPRRARFEAQPAEPVTTTGEISVRSVTENEQAPLSASEEQAWESLRRSLGES